MGYPAYLTDQTIEELRERVAELEQRNEALELVAAYAKDVIDFWPVMTMRTIRVMIPKMNMLKEALEFARGQNRSQP